MRENVPIDHVVTQGDAVRVELARRNYVQVRGTAASACTIVAEAGTYNENEAKRGKVPMTTSQRTERTESNLPKRMRSIYVAAAVALLSWTGASGNVIKYVCPTSHPGVEVRFVGNRGDKIEVHHHGKGVFLAAHQEGIDEMGGEPGLNCADVFSAGPIVVLRTGWKNDYAHIFAFEYLDVDGDGSEDWRVFQYRWLPRDGKMDIIDISWTDSHGWQVNLRNGHNDDRYYQVCFRQGTLWHYDGPQLFIGGWRNCNVPLPGNMYRVHHPTQLSGPVVFRFGWRVDCGYDGSWIVNSHEFHATGKDCSEARTRATFDADQAGCRRFGRKAKELGRTPVGLQGCQ